MKSTILAVMVTLGTATATHAALLQYDISMERVRANLIVSGVVGTGAVPDPFGSLDCAVDELGTTSCDPGAVDLTADESLGFAFPETISGRLVLDTEFDPFGAATGIEPSCSGSALLCRFVDTGREYLDYSASETGFRLIPDLFAFVSYEISPSGIRYEDDGVYDREVGTFFTAGFNFLRYDYATTDLAISEVAAVPLPAGAVLLGSALLALGRRRPS